MKYVCQITSKILYRAHDKPVNVSFNFHKTRENIDRTFVRKDGIDILRNYYLITKNMLITSVTMQ